MSVSQRSVGVPSLSMRRHARSNCEGVTFIALLGPVLIRVAVDG